MDNGLELLTKAGLKAIDEVTTHALQVIAQKNTRIEQLQNAYNLLRLAVKQLLSDLPQKRDWLNPDVERILRELTRENSGEKQ